MKNNRQSKQKSDLTKPLLLSVFLHLILIIALVWGGDFYQEKPKPIGNMVQAVVIDPQLIRQQAEQIKSRREAAAKKEQTRLDQLRRESARLEQDRKNAEDRIRQLKEQQVKDAKATREAEARRQQKEQERIAEEKRAAKAEIERKTQEAAVAKAEAERKAKEAEIAKAEKERLAREQAAKESAEKARKAQEAAQQAEKVRQQKEAAAKLAAEKAEQEKARLKKLEQERKEKEEALNDIFSGLKTEEQQNNSARNQYISEQTNRYGAIYTQLIEQNLRLEDSFKGKFCRVNLHLIPTGASAMIGSLKVLGGNKVVCAATQRAVAQVPSFPLPKDDPDVVKELRDIILSVQP